jgi:recombination protein RecA
MAKSLDRVDPRKIAAGNGASSSKSVPSDKLERAERQDRTEKSDRSPVVSVDVSPKAAPPRDPSRDSALSRAVQQIEKQFGRGAVMKLDSDKPQQIDGIPTGSLSLDLALGGFGVPRGRVCEIFGPESSGKTTLCLHIIASAQKAGGVAAFIDAEHALDPSWAKRLGVRLDDLLVSQPDTGEQALEICELLVRSNAVDVIVIDSVAALIPRAEIEGEMGDSHVGLQARLMSQALRKLTGAISRSRTTVIFINQIREKIGVMFGSPETTPGGRALKFYASVRVDVRRIQTIKEGDVSVGARTRARVVKNKIAPPFRDAEFDILFDRGISYEGDLIDLAVNSSIVEKSGAWLNYKATRLGQGKENARQFLRDNPDLAEEIRLAILRERGAGPCAGHGSSASKAE